MRLYALLMIGFSLLSMRESNSNYPEGQFKSPLNRQFQLSGTFGELRSNHFHAGLDIKSARGMIGDTVYAAASGYISRIQVDASGYGNVIYIDHPNGYTTVYGHLDHFAPLFQQYIKAEQYRQQQFEVDLCLAPFLFPVQQLQAIGILGNTGASQGPHLHFEIRHTDTQVPVNPLHFGYYIPDQVPPVIQQLIAYQFDDAGQLIQSTVLQPKLDSLGIYRLPVPFEIGVSRVTFGIRACDYQDGVDNQNGIYSLQCMADEEPSFAFALDEIPFQDMRYLNAHIDYQQKIYQNRFFHRCYPLEGNKLPIYFRGVDQGVIYLNTEQPRNVSISVADFNGNISKVNFEVVRNRNLFPSIALMPPFELLAQPDEVSIVTKPGIQVVWPKGSFYEKIPVEIIASPDIAKGQFCPRYELSPSDIPVHYYFDIAIEGRNIPARLQDKAFIARCDANGSISNCGGTWVGNNVTSSARQMGTYTILIDTIAPSISTYKFSSKMSTWKKMSFKISDNIRARERAKDLRYSAWVDGQWILMALDAKTGTLSHEFDGRIGPGEHQLIVKVWDDRDNEGVLQKSFTL